jgi:hypothetical protein
VFAYPYGGKRGLLYDPQASFQHDASLAHSGRLGLPVEIKRHHYPIISECAEGKLPMI